MTPIPVEDRLRTDLVMERHRRIQLEGMVADLRTKLEAYEAAIPDGKCELCGGGGGWHESDCINRCRHCERFAEIRRKFLWSD